jgi:hypothetical protein
VEVDECVSWADKAMALASYARQVDDETLRKLADRIKARAIRRVGEFLLSHRAAADFSNLSTSVPFSAFPELEEVAPVASIAAMPATAGWLVFMLAATAGHTVIASACFSRRKGQGRPAGRSARSG